LYITLTFTFSKDYKQNPPIRLGHRTYSAWNNFQASIVADGAFGTKNRQS